MRFSVSGNLNGRWEAFSAETATEAAAHAGRLHKLGVIIVYISKDGRLLTDGDELGRLLRQERGIHDVNRS